MSKKLISTLIASLFVATPALAQSDEPWRVTGSLTAGPIWNDTSGQNPAKLQEYQDVSNGARSSVLFQGRGGRTWIDFYGENFGRDDQYIFARGGQYDLFKFGAYSNYMPHNFQFDALTPYTGVGSGLLRATFPQTNPDNWNSFTLGYQRKDNGGYFEWGGLAPWYFRVDGNQVTFDGTKPYAGALGTSPGNGFMDLPSPQQYTTSNWGVEGGYQSNNLTASLRWDYSKFDNAVEQLNWINPYFGSGLDTTYLAPSNEFNKFTATANYRGLPWNSVISARYTWAEAKSDADLGLSALNSTAGAFSPTLPSENSFNGKHVTQTFQAAWTATPTRGLDTRVYYFYTKLENKSDLVEYGNAPVQPLASGLGCGTQPGLTPGSSVVGNCDNELFSYTKNNFGLDGYWRFTKGNRIGAGYDYYKIEQERIDYDEADVNKFFVEYKNTMLDNFTGRLKYTYIDRDSNYLEKDAGVNANDNAYLLRFTSAFDMQKMQGDWWKLTLDWQPMPVLGVSFEGIWKDNKFKDVTLGRTKEERQEYYVTATWGAPGGIVVTGYFDWEQVKYPSNHRYIGNAVCTSSGTTIIPPNCFDPATAPTNGAYNWNSKTTDENWAVGIGVDAPVNERFMVKASYFYMETNGKADFAVQDNGVTIPNLTYPVNIGNFDDTKHQSFQIKGIYNYSRNWSFTLGYAWEKYEQDDVAVNGYQYTIPAANNATSYLMGYPAFQNATQNIFYALATFKF